MLYTTAVYASDVAISPKNDEETLQEIIASAKDENEIRDKEVLTLLEKADATIAETLISSQAAVDTVEKTVIATGRLGPSDQDILNKKVSQVKQEIADFKDETSKIINEMRDNYTQKSISVLEAYDTYSLAVSSYYAGKITKEDMIAKGKTFKETVASLDMSIDTQRLAILKKLADQISIKTQEMQEDILNKISNSREYSDEDEEETSFLEKTTNGPRYTYNYHAEYKHAYLKSYYAGDKDKSFLMSKELMCDELDVTELETSSEQVQKFRDCVTRAKTEKEYFAVKGLNGCSPKKLQDCDPFADDLYKDYKNKGVYKHILEDYDTANVVNIARTKQYAHTWQGIYKKKSSKKCESVKKSECEVCDEGTLCELKNKAEDGTITNANDATKFLATVELEAAKLWSSLRRVDALHRSKKVVDYFSPMLTLYLDGRNVGNSDEPSPYDDAVEAAEKHPGVIKVEGKEQDVAPNVMLHVCKIKAEDISLDPEDPANEAKKDAAEKAIVKCMKTYAKWADKGTDAEEGAVDAKAVNDKKKLWKEKEFAAATDGMFKDLTIAAINLYKTSLDYAEEPPEDGINITSLQKDLDEKATQVMDGYAAGARINYYTTNQLLSIVDADAVELQAEIIQNLPEMAYNFFQIEEGGK